MTITPTAAATAASSQNVSRATLAQNFDTFLTLLTAQLSNQDPLDPVDSNQFTQQLVQYSQVEQQIQTNDYLKSLMGQQQAYGAGATLGYLGRMATVPGDRAQLANGQANWNYDVDSGAASVTLKIVNAAGRIVFETPGSTSAGAQAFAWNGKDAQGAALPEGRYRLQVEARDASGESVASRIRVEERITGVDLSGAEPRVITAQGPVDFKDISSVRE
jgi:flagellar basal-body rod modification protein FlgD